MSLAVDKYKSFEELRKNESPKNYEVDFCDRSSKFVIIALHGGGIADTLCQSYTECVLEVKELRDISCH